MTNNIDTISIHNHVDLSSDKSSRMVFNPLYQGSTVIFKTYQDFVKKTKNKVQKIKDIKPFAEYGRYHTPTVYELEKLICKLEHGDFARVTNGGLSAVTTSILSYLKAGDHILVSDGSYIKTRKFCQTILSKFGIEYDFYDTLNYMKDIKSKTKPNTKAIFLEFPSSNTYELIDLEKISYYSKENKMLTICDSTLVSPILCNPLKHGIDVVCISLSKFILGHADSMLGCIIAKEKNFKPLYDYTNLIGNHANSQAAYLAIRGLKTVHLRMMESVKRGNEFIKHISKHQKINTILHPSCYSGSEGKKIFKKYLPHGAPSMFTIVLNRKYSEEKLEKFFNSLEFFSLGFSYGSFESLCVPYSLDFRIGKIKEYAQYTCIRIYIGLENIDDLIDDFTKALHKL